MSCPDCDGIGGHDCTIPARNEAPNMTGERVRDYDQPGWNQGYIAGEHERIALAEANTELRTDLDNALRMIADLLRRLEGTAT